MEGIRINELDTTSVVCGAVGGLLVGAVSAGLLVHYVARRRAAAHDEEVVGYFVDREQRLKEDYDSLVTRQANKINDLLAEPYQSPATVEREFELPPEDEVRDEGQAADPAVVQRGEEFVRRLTSDPAPGPSGTNLFQSVRDGLIEGGRVDAVPDEPDDSIRGGFEEDPTDDSDPSVATVVAERPDPVDTSPHEVTREEFEDDHGWNRATIYYYRDDGVLADDDHKPVRDVVPLVGYGLADKFGNNVDDPDVVLICCPRNRTYYEICLVDDSYLHSVLGAGNKE